MNQPPSPDRPEIAAREPGATEADARSYREAAAEGRLAVWLDLDEVTVDHIRRDRLVTDDEAMAELRASIAAHGQRQPIEVVRLEDAAEPARFGLIAGFRRLMALRDLRADCGDARFGRVKAIVAPALTAAEAYVGMVEENEIRSALSHYERGRIAVLAADQGVFESVETAVNRLYASGSRAKRSKIRRFALIHEELGDLLLFGHRLAERPGGLRLANAIRHGAGLEMRDRLGRTLTAEAEWQLLEEIIEGYEAYAAEEDGRRPPRPASRSVLPVRKGRIVLLNGVAVDRIVGDSHISLRFSGRHATDELVDHVVEAIERLLG